MDRQNKIEFISKFLEAKTMEKEAFKLLIPEHIRKHVDNIEKELQSILFEVICKENPHETDKGTKGKVKKVDIQ